MTPQHVDITPTPEQREQAEKVFRMLCAAFDSYEFRYQTDRGSDGSLVAFGGCRCKAFATTVIAVVRPQLWLVSFLAKVPCTVPENRRFETAAAVAQANYNRYEGNFDYNLRTGDISWRLSSNYYGCEPDVEHYRMLLAKTATVLEDIGGPLAAVGEGRITLAEFCANPT
jgi:hypothetical protein